MSIETKLIITLGIFGIITHLAAFPHSTFGKWGTKRFNGYGTFLVSLFVLYFVPILAICLYVLWFKN